MATTSVLLGSSMGLEIVSGLFNMNASESQASALRSQASLVRAETAAEIERYKISASRYKASQKMAYIKSGVQIEGSPLDVLDETARTASENISAIRAQGEAEATKLTSQARQVRSAGRAALVGGFTKAAGLYAMYGDFGATKGPGTGMYNPGSNLNLYSNTSELGKRLGF